MHNIVLCDYLENFIIDLTLENTFKSTITLKNQINDLFGK